MAQNRLRRSSHDASRHIRKTRQNMYLRQRKIQISDFRQWRTLIFNLLHRDVEGP